MQTLNFKPLYCFTRKIKTKADTTTIKSKFNTGCKLGDIVCTITVTYTAGTSK